MAKFEVYTDARGEYRFRLKANNGQNILASEGYSAKAGCMNGIESVRKNSQDDRKFDRKKSSNGKHYFNLKATNGQIIGTSEMYESSSGMENGIASVKTNAPNASVEEV
ncbi:YegP family protein [Psychroserpens mesophilus]|uniref:YegP family protein n=1 Tax=Psychroserpens mesophilus TaxID=325473 RepID=UPI003D64DAE2